MHIELKKTCSSALDAAQQGLAWISDPANAERVGISRGGAEQQLRKSITATRKTLAAIDRPMCVSVFGPSQAGKSYLVSVLARPTEGPLMARFNGLEHNVDFIREINPGGDRESTGLVTRFSIRQEPSPDGAPVVVRMLSETDIAKVLGNSFFFDGDPKKRPSLDSKTVLDVLDAARRRAAMQNLPQGPKQEDIWDLQEYFEKQFAGLSYIETLAAYWEEAAELAPRLSVDDRADLFSLLWGNVAPFTAAYRELVTALEKLGFPKDAYCPIEAIVPREKSIIDVATLSGLGQAGQEQLRIQSMNGPAISLPRPVITALAAELRIAIEGRPSPFFEHTDLLDFPGARSRQKIDFEVYFDDKQDALQDLFRRGKVAFLFDRYVAEQELSAMLLCIKPSNQEVVELPDMIDSWIQTSHGATPVERSRVATALFLVLTMMDTHFTEKAGQEGQSLSDRFRARLNASLTSYFGKAHKWPFEWTPGKPFNNVFWLRNPNFKSEFMIRYDGGKEVEILPGKKEMIDKLREAYLQVDEVQQHFSDPAEAFDAALTLNDGGVRYLAEHLAPVCRPEIKYGQIRERIGVIAHEVRRILSPYFVDNDVTKRLIERQEISDLILERMQETSAQHKFGSAMRLLQISQNGISEHLHIEYGKRTSAAVTASPAAKLAASSGTVRRQAVPPLPGERRKKAQAAAQTQPAPVVSQKMLTKEAYLAKAAVRHWTENLFAISRNDDVLYALGLDAETASELVSEIVAGARRCGLEDQIAEDLAKVSGDAIEHADILLEKAGFFATSHINRFISTLGFDRLPEEKRPKAPTDENDEEVPIFALRRAFSNCDNLPTEKRDFAFLSVSEWMYAFNQLVSDNVLLGDGPAINPEQNGRLKAIIDTLDGVASTGGGTR